MRPKKKTENTIQLEKNPIPPKGYRLKIENHPMKRLLIFPLILICFLLKPIAAEPDPSDPTLSPEERLKIIQNQETRWEIGKSSPNPTPFLFSVLKPAVEFFSTDLESVMDIGNFRLTIPPRSFPKTNRVEVRVITLNNHADFLFAGIPTQIGPNRSPNLLLESTGMFYVSFFDEDGKRIEPKKKLRVELFPLADPNGSNIYRYTKGNWDLISEKQETSTISEIEGADSIPFQIYSKIDSSGWWNFDKPKPEFTCVTGKILAKNPEEFSIQGIGIDYFGTSYGSIEPSGIFTLNVLKDSNVKIFAVLTPKNKKTQKEIGFLPTFRTQKLTTFSSEKKSQCQKVSEISTFPIEESVFKDRTQFLKAIDMPDL
ncbi:hypothetical protein [Leptospira ainazelensis]|uniref:hypothetical protein n=1 Tax=Leptospira ainazelensis TaxID=2810034 RepID=UPI001E2BCCA9|nr:hypothetical protein [Leptospira ainazelensis]